MKYILNPNVALRSWRLVPYAYYIKHQRDAIGLSREQFELLSRTSARIGRIGSGAPVRGEREIDRLAKTEGLRQPLFSVHELDDHGEVQLQLPALL